MKSFKSYQHLRLVTSEGMIANGEFIRDGFILRIKNGYLCDSTSYDPQDKETKILPAVEAQNGTHIEHWKDGVLHCETEPAIINLSENIEEWWISGNQVQSVSQEVIG
ncbi:MAG: hypothetical protein MJ185_02830 [Treponema sp.]|nr:hypothetical protein [Treponema sp.]